MKSLIVIAVMLSTVNAYSGGYEKAIMWSGKWAALGGSASAAVDGSDAIFFNPAGLVDGNDREITVSLSPTISKVNAPILTSGEQESGEQIVSPIFAVTYKQKVNEKVAFGASMAAAGGAKAKFEGVDFATVTHDVTQMTSIENLEISLGAGFQVSETWSFGAAWRATLIAAEIQAVAPNATPGLTQLNFSDLTASNLSGLRLGAKFKPSAEWGMGLTYRSEVSFEADGKFQALNYPTATPDTPVDPPIVSTTDVKGVESTFPSSFSLDYFRHLNERWTIYWGYTKASYSVNEAVNLGDNGLQPELEQHWNDAEIVRFAGEYKSLKDWVLRGSYIYTSQVVPEDYAFSTFPTPGAGHSIVIGGGKTLLDKYVFDIAFEYGWAEAKDITNSSTINGDYDTSIYSLHASVSIPL